MNCQEFHNIHFIMSEYFFSKLLSLDLLQKEIGGSYRRKQVQYFQSCFDAPIPCKVSLIIEIPGRRGERPLCSNQIFRGAKVSANVGLSKRVILQDLNFTQEVELNSSFRNANSKPRGLRGVKHSLCLWSLRHNSQFGPWLRRVHWILHKRVL